MTEPFANILIVDDDRQARLKLARILEGKGYHVSEVDGGRAALETLAHEPFDLVLLDILMPEVDGIEVLKTLQADTRLSVIPVIVVSAVDDPQGIEKFKQLGARGYLTKPVDPDELVARVGECLGGAR